MTTLHARRFILASMLSLPAAATAYGGMLWLGDEDDEEAEAAPGARPRRLKHRPKNEAAAHWRPRGDGAETKPSRPTPSAAQLAAGEKR